MFVIVVTTIVGLTSHALQLPESYSSLRACDRMLVPVAKRFVPETNMEIRFNCEHFNGSHR